MIIQILLVIAGLALVVFGADWLVDGASAIAKKAGISDFVIGLTIVGFGTSCPELVVSLTGAFEGLSDVSIGNVVGSNIFNIWLILGITALIAPISITAHNKKADIPMMLAATLLLVLFGFKHSLFGLGAHDGLTRVEGIVFLLIFTAYIFYCFKSGNPNEEEDGGRKIGIWAGILLTLAGLAGLVVGGRLFVDNAVEIARALNISEKFIAITLLAGGTSLPELATCIMAAAKHKGQLALGNILGSNVFNILLILGCSAVVTPLDFQSMNAVDMAALVLSAVLLLACSFTGDRNRIDRWEAALMLVCEAAYMYVLVSNMGVS